MIHYPAPANPYGSAPEPLQLALKQEYGMQAPLSLEVYNHIYKLIKAAYERRHESSPIASNPVHEQQYNAPNQALYGQQYKASSLASVNMANANNAYNQQSTAPNHQPLKYVAPTPVSYFTPTDSYRQQRYIQSQNHGLYQQSQYNNY